MTPRRDLLVPLLLLLGSLSACVDYTLDADVPHIPLGELEVERPMRGVPFEGGPVLDTGLLGPASCPEFAALEPEPLELTCSPVGEVDWELTLEWAWTDPYGYLGSPLVLTMPGEDCPTVLLDSVEVRRLDGRTGAEITNYGTWSFHGQDWDGRLGSYVASAGDMNADGYADILMGSNGDCTGAEDAGAVFLVPGPVTGHQAINAVGTRFYSLHTNDHLRKMAPADDVNGDGVPDLLIGTMSSDVRGLDAGAVWLFYGWPGL